MNLIDAHCHIDWFSENELQKIINDVDKIYAVSVDYQSALKVLAIGEKHPKVKIALGIHPEQFENYREFPMMKRLIVKNRDRLYAIGEVGLPYFSLLDKPLEEKESLYREGLILLEKFVILAKELNLPLILHATKLTSIDAFNLLQKYDIQNALFHWLNCDKDAGDKIFEAGYFASASLDILYNDEYLNFVKTIPLKNLLIESDSPWKYDDTISRPKDIEKVAEKLSEIHNVSKNEILRVCSKNIDIFLKN